MAPSAQLEFDFAAGATVVASRASARPPWASGRLTREDEALLAAAVRRLRARARQWLPPMLQLTPEALLGWSMVKTARAWNDPELEQAGLKLMGYRVH
jgi:hypothetical protein